MRSMGIERRAWRNAGDPRAQTARSGFRTELLWSYHTGMETPSSPSFGAAVLARFAQKNPVAASLRLTFEQLFAPAVLDAVFEQHRSQQYPRHLAFSSLVDVMGAVVTGRSVSVNAELQKRVDSLPVSIQAVYSKLNGTEPAVCAAMVAHTAAKARALLTEMGGLRAPLLPDFRVRVLDGNHLAATERRLLPLAQVAAGPLLEFRVSLEVAGFHGSERSVARRARHAWKAARACAPGGRAHREDEVRLSTSRGARRTDPRVARALLPGRARCMCLRRVRRAASRRR